MKIGGLGNLQGAARARKKNLSGETGEGFMAESSKSSGSTESVGALSGTSAVASVDALFELQGAGDFREAKKRATERAVDLLDVLDDLKIALLEGGVPRSKLTRLMETLRTQRDATNDPELEEALDEVELRAAVELAKYDA